MINTKVSYLRKDSYVLKCKYNTNLLLTKGTATQQETTDSRLSSSQTTVPDNTLPTASPTESTSNDHTDDNVAVVYPVNTPLNVAPVFVPSTPFSNSIEDVDGGSTSSSRNIYNNVYDEALDEDIEIVRPTYSSAVPTVSPAALQRLAQLKAWPSRSALNELNQSRISNTLNNRAVTTTVSTTNAGVLTTKPAHISPVYRSSSTKSSSNLPVSQSSSLPKSSQLAFLKGKRS